MNEKTVKLLEFDAIRGRVAVCALSEEASNCILADVPKLDEEETQTLKGLVSAALDRINEIDSEKRDSIPDISGIIPKLNVEGTILEIDEAYALGLFIERGEALKAWLGKTGAETPLTPLLLDLPDCVSVSTEIFRILDKEGKLRDLSEFRDIRRRIQALAKDLETAGMKYTGNDETRRMLQSGVPSQRDGRMVLAVKANYRGRIKGIVHEVSSTGQTLFVEPEEVVEKNNELLIENRRLDAEIRRVLREMTGRILASHTQIAKFHEGIVHLETLRARARYGFETRGKFAALDRDGALILKKARHPLLGAKAVPLDFAMNGNTRTVIVTGPNTGGKTVALKTAGLLALMNQFGLPLPIDEGSCLPIFDGVYADIGDEQSISQSLSTFSSHMTNIASICSRAGERSLVLLDELGSGTDPEEGSAIAMAILDHLIEKRSRLIATTHHGILKNYGYTRKGVQNASMEFDGKTLSPTFRIVMGIPGESRAVDIAARNGLGADIVAKARTYLAEEQADISVLINGLREKHRELDAATEAGKAEEQRLREERRKADLKELRLRQKELHLKTEGAGSLRHLLGESRKQLENLVREIKEGEITRDKTLKVKEFLSDLEASVKAENVDLEKEESDLAEERRRLEDEADPAGSGSGGYSGNPQLILEPGAWVKAGSRGGRGRIIRTDKKGFWIVELGALKMSFAEKDLVPIPPPKDEIKPLISAADLAPSSPVQMEINLRGMRLDEALEALRQQVDAAVLSGLHEFSVVHGKGDGILQKGVHDYLRREKSVADYYFSRPEMGGFGRTEVILK
ncbi:endonuclease MutS2 [Leadbettera azotonutricia]|uniref:Endonuclease MutS2 n=1 Tax=Leadbettera azotonutricia (strain ATCC BAA-888 / DSM 13862 / ZAS-9) TaxID=545695 RepID=F5Y882_LEAAZ|nr:Smr/MutS family protein [Leadbettera azotonutricia]AEF80568.1 MutS2 family protein [Leadbettera azotonutricia ZAS-9]